MGVYVGKLLRNGLIHVLYAQNIFHDHFIVKKGQTVYKKKGCPEIQNHGFLRYILHLKSCNFLYELQKWLTYLEQNNSCS